MIFQVFWLLKVIRKEELVNALIAESKKAIDEDGAGTIVLGCTAMVGVKEAMEEALTKEGYGAPVIEAGQAALVMLETFVRMGLSHSRARYMSPRKKLRTWWGGNDSVEI